MTAKTRMSHAVSVAALALTLTACATTDVEQKVATQPFPPDRLIAIDNVVEVAWQESRAPGVVVGIWIPGEGSYVATRGPADLATGQPMRVDDHIRIGSITKTFTATLLLHPRRREEAGLDDPVSKYVTVGVPTDSNITLRMLANMTAGLASYTEDEAFVKDASTPTGIACGRRASWWTWVSSSSPRSRPAPAGTTATPTPCCSA